MKTIIPVPRSFHTRAKSIAKHIGIAIFVKWFGAVPECPVYERGEIVNINRRI